MASESTTPPWPSRPSGEGVCPEYRRALEESVVAPGLLATSLQSTRLAALAARAAPVTEESLDLTTIALLRSAYDLGTDSAVRTFVGTTPVPHNDGSLAGGNLYSELRLYMQGLSWEIPVLIVALTDIMREEGHDGLQVVVGLLVRSARECNARRRATFSAIVSRTERPSAPESRGAAPVLPSTVASHPFARDAAIRTYERAAVFVDALKDRAVASTFVEPCAGM